MSSLSTTFKVRSVAELLVLVRQVNHDRHVELLCELELGADGDFFLIGLAVETDFADGHTRFAPAILLDDR